MSAALMVLCALNANARNRGAVMRLFKPLEHLQAALKAIHSSGTPLEQWTVIGRQLSYAGYLSFDALVWVRPFPFTLAYCALTRLV